MQIFPWIAGLLVGSAAGLSVERREFGDDRGLFSCPFNTDANRRIKPPFAAACCPGAGDNAFVSSKCRFGTIDRIKKKKKHESCIWKLIFVVYPRPVHLDTITGRCDRPGEKPACCRLLTGTNVRGYAVYVSWHANNKDDQDIKCYAREEAVDMAEAELAAQSP